jgi:hypothetical protein
VIIQALTDVATNDLLDEAGIIQTPTAGGYGDPKKRQA